MFADLAELFADLAELFTDLAEWFADLAELFVNLANSTVILISACLSFYSLYVGMIKKRAVYDCIVGNCHPPGSMVLLYVVT